MARVSSRAFKADRTAYRAACAEATLACWICSQAIDYDAPFDAYSNDDRFELDHYYPVATHPDLQADPANYRPSHAGCNRARGTSSVTSTLAGTLSRDWANEKNRD